MNDHHPDQFAVGVVGCGKLALTIIRGLVNSGQFHEENIWVSVKTKESEEKLRTTTKLVVTDTLSVVKHADVILLGVKPEHVWQVVTDEFSLALFRKFLISLVAGLRLDDLRDRLYMYGSTSLSIVRAMPNVASSIRESMTILCPNIEVKEHELKRASTIFSSVGQVRFLDEKYMDIATILAGSGPALCAFFAEAMADGGLLAGMPKDIALMLVAHVMVGTGRLLLGESPAMQGTPPAGSMKGLTISGIHPALLQDSVATPGGCTIACLMELERAGVRGTVMESVHRGVERLREMSANQKQPIQPNPPINLVPPY